MWSFGLFLRGLLGLIAALPFTGRQRHRRRAPTPTRTRKCSKSRWLRRADVATVALNQIDSGLLDYFINWTKVIPWVWMGLPCTPNMIRERTGRHPSFPNPVQFSHTTSTLSPKKADAKTSRSLHRPQRKCRPVVEEHRDHYEY